MENLNNPTISLVYRFFGSPDWLKHIFLGLSVNYFLISAVSHCKARPLSRPYPLAARILISLHRLPRVPFILGLIGAVVHVTHYTCLYRKPPTIIQHYYNPALASILYLWASLPSMIINFCYLFTCRRLHSHRTKLPFQVISQLPTASLPMVPSNIPRSQAHPVCTWYDRRRYVITTS